MVNDQFNLLRLPQVLQDKAIEKIVKLNDTTIAIQKVITLSDDEEIIISQVKQTVDQLNAAINEYDDTISKYQDSEWIAEQISSIQAKKDVIQEQKNLLN